MAFGLCGVNGAAVTKLVVVGPNGKRGSASTPTPTVKDRNVLGMTILMSIVTHSVVSIYKS